jgi:hypothetical protein
MSNNTARKRPVPCHSGDFMEAVFQPEIFGIFSDEIPTGSCRKAQEIDRNSPEKIQKISGRNTASTFGDFRSFPVGSDDVSASFLQDPVAVIFDLGSYEKHQ